MKSDADPTPSQMRGDYSNWDLIRDLYGYVRPYRVQFILATLIRVVADTAWLYPAFGIASLVTFLTAYEPGTSLEPAYLIFGLLVGATIVRYGGGYIAKMLMFRVSERVGLNTQTAAISHLYDLDIAWHERENTGNKLKRITRGADSADRVLRIWINNVVPIAINLIGITIVIARFDALISAFTVVFIVTYYLFATNLRGKAKHATAVANAQDEELQGTLFEGLNNIRTVKVLGMAAPLLARVAEQTDDLYQKILRRIFWFQVGGYSRGFYGYIVQLGIMSFIAYGIVQGRYEIGFLVLFIGYFSTLLSSIAELADIAQEYVIARLSVGRMFEILHEPINIDDTEGKKAFPADWQKISIENLSFTYGDHQVLHDVSFDIPRGEKVGIVGLSGAGKSTIFKLLLKEYESYEGTITIDDVPLRDISRRDYFDYTAVVLQDTEVFNLSLKENIVLANQTQMENEDLLERSLQVAHVHDFMSRLPEGMETHIGEKGVRLSGGERQRVGIARAVFKEPQLLLLDEATSHLDIESEEKIRASLHEFFQNVTAVVIAHRLTTIREMDRIIVLEGGRILESGSFDELYAKKGRFYDLWEKQSL